MSKPEKIFIVFSPEGPTAPVKTYPTHKSAAHDAWEMARKYPTQTFYVMQKAGRPARFADVKDAAEVQQEAA
jgi:hypothetical protein